VRKIVVPLASKTASKELVKFEPRSRIRNRMSANRPAISPQRILLRQPDDYAGDARGRRRPGLRRFRVSYLFAASLWCQASSVAGMTGKISVQRLRGRSRASAAKHTRSAGSYRTRPMLRRSTAFSCRSTSNSAAFARSPRNARTATPRSRHVSR